jgi:alcohol dehydrogenase class IV
VALEGMRLIAQFLPRACADGGDIEARANMLIAASMGATAFQKGLGGVHAIAHPVGSWFDTHHGLTNAIVLPYVMRHNRRAIVEKSELIARMLDLSGPGFDRLLEWILELRGTLGIAHSLAEIGVDLRNAAVIGQDAFRDPSAAGNPIPVDADALERVFRAAVASDLKAVG